MQRLPTAMIVSAQIRAAARDGVAIVVVHKGEEDHGAILLKINRLDGTAEVLSQITLDEQPAWIPAMETRRVSEREADAYLAQQAQADPDLWTIEIEDRKGRLWFEGRVVEV